MNGSIVFVSEGHQDIPNFYSEWVEWEVTLYLHNDIEISLSSNKRRSRYILSKIVIHEYSIIIEISIYILEMQYKNRKENW